jgi:hypothetical protein
MIAGKNPIKESIENPQKLLLLFPSQYPIPPLHQIQPIHPLAPLPFS